MSTCASTHASTKASTKAATRRAQRTRAVRARPAQDNGGSREPLAAVLGDAASAVTYVLSPEMASGAHVSAYHCTCGVTGEDGADVGLVLVVAQRSHEVRRQILEAMRGVF